MNANKILSQKTSGLCGVLAPVIGLTCIGMAVLISPWFSWTENYLSDLGGFPGDRPIWAAHGTASIIFNIGLIVAGVLGVLFVLGLRKNHLLDSPLGNIGIIFYFLDACALIGIGIFPETTGPPHTFFSITFFVLVGLALVFIGTALMKSSEKKLGGLTIALFIFCLVSVPLFLKPQPVGSNAIAEMIPIISVSIFSVAFGYRLFHLGHIKERKNVDHRIKEKD